MSCLGESRFLYDEPAFAVPSWEPLTVQQVASPSVLSGEAIWCARALLHPKVEISEPHTQHVDLRMVGQLK